MAEQRYIYSDKRITVTMQSKEPLSLIKAQTTIKISGYILVDKKVIKEKIKNGKAIYISTMIFDVKEHFDKYARKQIGTTQKERMKKSMWLNVREEW